MARKRFHKLPPPTAEAIKESIERGQEVILISTDNDARCLFLKFQCRNGNTATIWFDAFKADYLLRHLEMVFLGDISNPGGGSRLRMVRVLRESYGTVPRPI